MASALVVYMRGSDPVPSIIHYALGPAMQVISWPDCVTGIRLLQPVFDVDGTPTRVDVFASDVLMDSAGAANYDSVVSVRTASLIPFRVECWGRPERCLGKPP